MSESTTIALSEIIAKRCGSVDPSKYPDEIFDLYSVPSFDRLEPEVLKGGEIGSTKQIVQPGDVILSKIVPHIRRAWIVGKNRGRRILASSEWIVFRSKQSDATYLRHVLVSDPFHAEFMRTVSGVGGSLLRARPEYVAKIKIPLPSIAQQKRIAAILDKAEELRGLRRQALGELDALSQSIFLEMFGNPLINPSKFPVQKLGELCSRVMDCPHSTPTYATRSTPYACVRSSDIQNNELVFGEVKFVEHEEYKKRIERGAPQPGDVIYCREGARFGNAALVINSTPSICLGQRMMLFRPEISKANGEFIWGYLSSPIAYHQALREVGGSASPHINIRDIVAFQIPVPPLIKQQEFARRVEAIEQLKAIHRESLAHLDTLFASLQHRAFRGEL